MAQLPTPLTISGKAPNKVQASARSRGWVDLTKQVSFLKNSPDFVGPYSSIYKGTWKGEEVAIKVIKVISEKPLTMQRKFVREITAWATIKHPNIVPFYGFTDGTGLFAPIGSLISPWYCNGDATHFLKGRGSTLSLKARIDLWRGVVSGVRHLHENDPPIVHGDLKPSNILIDNNDNPKICDFGLVRIFQEEAGTPLATTSPFTGTDRYLAPELLDEDAKPTPASDVWALGCLGYELIYSTLPYQHISVRGGRHATLHLFNEIKAGVPPASRPPDIDIEAESIWQILEECWHRPTSTRPRAQTILRLLEGKQKTLPQKPTTTLWREGTNISSMELKGHTKWVSSVAFSPDGRYIISGSGDRTIRLWDSSTGQEVKAPFTGHTDRILSVAFSSIGTRVVSGSMDNMVMRWNVKTGHQVGVPLKGHSDSVYSVAFSPDCSRIASGSGDRTIILWDTATGNMLKPPFTAHTAGVLSIAFSPDGTRIVSGSWDSMIILWDVTTGQPLDLPFLGHNGGILSVAFSADGSRIVSGAEDQTVRVWDVKTGKPIGSPLIGHGLAIHCVAFSLDGTCIASGSHDNTIRLWDTATGQALQAPLKGHSAWVRSVAFSPDGTRIISGSLDSTIRLWNAVSPNP